MEQTGGCRRPRGEERPVGAHCQDAPRNSSAGMSQSWAAEQTREQSGWGPARGQGGSITGHERPRCGRQSERVRVPRAPRVTPRGPRLALGEGKTLQECQNDRCGAGPGWDENWLGAKRLRGQVCTGQQAAGVSSVGASRRMGPGELRDQSATNLGLVRPRVGAGCRGGQGMSGTQGC